eukprot:Hpha_TRINITY_DN11727_c0_g3::TRINITY_DN11727_c0_g3_i1::g.32092::m.32092
MALAIESGLLCVDSLEHSSRTVLRQLERHCFSEIQELLHHTAVAAAKDARRFEREKDVQAQLMARLKAADERVAELREVKIDARAVRETLQRDAEVTQLQEALESQRNQVQRLEERLADAEGRAGRVFSLEASLQERTEALKDLARELKLTGHPLTEVVQAQATAESQSDIDPLLADETLSTAHALAFRQALREQRDRGKLTAAALLEGDSIEGDSPAQPPLPKTSPQAPVDDYSDDDFED